MPALAENLVLKVVSEIHDPVTTTDELIPSGETSSFRSNPLGLAEFTLSRRDPEYVGRAKEIQKAQKAIEAGVVKLNVSIEEFTTDIRMIVIGNVFEWCLRNGEADFEGNMSRSLGKYLESTLCEVEKN